jgi:uncharacterized membrane protein YqiK
MENPILLGMVVNFVVIGLLLFIYFSRIRHAGPNEALIVFGRGPRSQTNRDGAAFRLVISGRTLVWPIVERAEILSLEPRRAEANFRDLRGVDGQRRQLDVTIQYKVGHSEELIRLAVMQLLSKSDPEKNTLVMDLVEEEIRKLVAGQEWLELEKAPDKLQTAVREQIAPRLGGLGLEIVSLVIK